MSAIHVCGPGCCPGCQDCYGMQIGCHQDPCRCEAPCTCRWSDEDTDPQWQAGCVRHNSETDRRAEYDRAGDDEAAGVCPACGESGPCSFDGDGRPMWHSGAENAS